MKIFTKTTCSVLTFALISLLSHTYAEINKITYSGIIAAESDINIDINSGMGLGGQSYPSFEENSNFDEDYNSPTINESEMSNEENSFDKESYKPNDDNRPSSINESHLIENYKLPLTNENNQSSKNIHLPTSCVNSDNLFSQESECSFSCKPTCGFGVFVNVDLIFFRAFADGLDSSSDVSTVNLISDDFVSSTYRATEREPHFKWNVGFRVGLGYRLNCDWDIMASYTCFHSRARGSDAQWRLDFDVIDLAARFDAYIGPYFIIRPLLGIRGVMIDQTWRIGSFPNEDFIFEEDVVISRDDKQKLWGVGPLLGLEALWDVGYGVSFYTNAGLAILYGRFDITLIENSVTFDSISVSEVIKHLEASVAAADAGVGVRWHTCLWDNNQMTLQLGLEHHRYFDYNRLGNRGDLSLDAINLSVTIEF